MGSTCLGQEFASTWFSWQIDQPGTITFVLTPIADFDDLDFAVFRFDGDLLCQEKILQRCMAAGENIGDSLGSIPCTGPTGLNLTETDIDEQPGCNNGNNNFLRFLDCQAGESFALVVNNFSSSGGGFTLEWGGSATFNASPTDINSPTHEASGLSLMIGPNPTRGLLQLFGLENSGRVAYRITDNFGRQVRAGQLQAGSRHLDVSTLASGVYFLTIMSEEGKQVQKFVVE